MKRFFVVMLTLTVTVGLAVLACGGDCVMSMKGVERSFKDIDNGVEVTVTAGDAETVKALQDHVAKKMEKAKGDCPKHAAKAAEAKAEGGCMFCGHPEWSRQINNNDKGFVMVLTSTNPDEVKKIQTMAASMGHPKGDCPHAKGKKGDCDKHREAAPRT